MACTPITVPNATDTPEVTQYTSPGYLNDLYSKNQSLVDPNLDGINADSSEVNVEPIKLSDLTNSSKMDSGILNGTGVFDVLMNTVNLIVTDQYDANRLRGKEFADVFLGLVQTAISTSNTFLLTGKKTEADIVARRIEDKLVRANIDVARTTNLLTAAKVVESNRSATLVTAKIAETEANIPKVVYETNKLRADTEYTNARTVLTKVETDLVPIKGCLTHAQIADVENDIALKTNQDILDGEFKAQKTLGEKLKNGKIDVDITYNADGSINHVTYDVTSASSGLDIYTSQIRTENAKTLLVERQTEGFDDDAKSKLLKTVVDGWSVHHTMTDATASADGLSDTNVTSIINGIKSSVGLS